MSAKEIDFSKYTNLVDSIRIDHSGFEAAAKALSEAYDDVGTTATPVCLHLVGETRTGKSCLINDFLSKHEKRWLGEGVRQTVVYAAAPPKATVKSLLEQLLKGLGDPHWNRGSESNMTHRLLTMLNGVGCRMIILDEFQHLCDKGQHRRLFMSADWLKALVEEKKWALVAVGLPESASVINTNRQLAGRFDATITMPLFDWRDTGSRRQFKGILKAFSDELAPFEVPDLACDEVALRMYLATSGRVGLLAKLLDCAVKTAIRKQTRKIRLDDLGGAFTKAIWFAPRFPLGGGPFHAGYEECLREDVAAKVVEIASRDEYEDNSGSVSIREPRARRGDSDDARTDVQRKPTAPKSMSKTAVRKEMERTL